MWTGSSLQGCHRCLERPTGHSATPLLDWPAVDTIYKVELDSKSYRIKQFEEVEERDDNNPPDLACTRAK